MKKLQFCLLFLIQVIFVCAQQTTSLKGKVIDYKSYLPLENTTITIKNTNIAIQTNADGTFIVKQIAKGNHIITVSYTGYTSQSFSLFLVEGKTLDLGIIMLQEDVTSEQQLGLITLTENDLGESNNNSQNTVGLLQATKDVFQQTAAFNWGQARFRIRGIDNEYGKTLINGIAMNKMYDGRPQWSNWGGLNDATRNQEFTPGSSPSDYTFGAILGSLEINTRASVFRPGTRISFSGANTNYSSRTMVTHASGINRNGFAFAVSASRRLAQEGHFEGTNYSANSIFISAEKRFNDTHALNFTGIYAQNSMGKNSANTQEVTNISGTKYNSYWGWQNGKKRNSRDKDVEEPILMLNHYWKIDAKNNLNTNISYQFGHIGNSRLEYQNARNPDPTYYQYLPSYGDTNPYFLDNRQIDWDNLYNANINAGKSVYALYEDRTDDKIFTVNTLFYSQLSNNISLNAGISYRRLKSHNYQKMLDLLGGNHFLDINSFQTGDKIQSDLNNPNRNIYVGDAFGYNYNLFGNNLEAFTQFKFYYKNFDFYLAQSFSNTTYQREGLYKNGIYEDNSFGKSDNVTFENFGFKGGLTYRITGRYILDFNAIRMTKAPTLKNTFGNARLNNTIIEDGVGETISSIDASYIIRGPKFKSRLTGYFSNLKNVTELGFFFAEGLALIDNSGQLLSGNAFITEIVTGLEKQNVGIELGTEYQISSTIKITSSVSYGQYIYANNPNVKLNIDNLQSTLDYGTAYLKNYKLSGMPQQAYSIGLEYRAPDFWWIGTNINHLTGNYIDISPLLRTHNFVKEFSDLEILPDDIDAKVKSILKQEKSNPVTLVNLTGGKSWKKYNKIFGFFASINNVFNYTYKTGGYEQARNATYTSLSQDIANGNPFFGPKYFYGYGRNYFINIYVNL